MIDFQSLWNFKRNPHYEIQDVSIQQPYCYVLPRFVFLDVGPVFQFKRFYVDFLVQSVFLNQNHRMFC